MRARQRWVGVAAVVSLAAATAACGRTAAAAPTSDGTLVLEVGGAQSSLREALAAAGIVPAPAHRLRSDVGTDTAADPREPGAAGAGPVGEGPTPEPTAGGAAPPPPDEAAADDVPEVVEVRLGKGQTLIHLAKRHLGDGNRFRELLELNGWDDEDARRLREGQVVKVPKAKSTAAKPARSAERGKR